MKKFIIEPENLCYTNPLNGRRECKPFLRNRIRGYYNEDYYGGGNQKIKGTIENLICTLKNDITPYSDFVLAEAQNKLIDILREDLDTISYIEDFDCICVVPRSFAKDTYTEKQLLFHKCINYVVIDFCTRDEEFRCDWALENGTDYIIRHTDTQCTHRARAGHGGKDNLPYPGITKDTCYISTKVKDKKILLIDDLYTRSVGIDEDVIQAPLYNGAKEVIFYSLGKTVMR